MTSQWISVIEGLWSCGNSYIEKAGTKFWVTLPVASDNDPLSLNVRELGPYYSLDAAKNTADRMNAQNTNPVFVRLAIKTALRQEPCSIRLLKDVYLKEHNIPNYLLISELNRLIESHEIVPENGTEGEDIWFFLARGE